jgi:hypothetical protein
MSPLPQTNPLRRWLTGLVENTFNAEVGLCDPAVLAYISELLTEFIHIERINQVADGSGRQIEDLAELLCQAEAPTAAADARRRELYRHIGDFTLFWTGVYPENLRRMHRRQSCDDLLDYFEQGKRSYAIASQLGSETAEPPSFVLQALSDGFEYCVYGLGLVRKNWEHDSAGGGASVVILH